MPRYDIIIVIISIKLGEQEIMKKLGNWLWGIVLIALGVIWGINALGIAHIDIFFPGWWTLFIIVPCTIGLITDEHKWGNFIGLLIGVCFLLGCLDVLEFDMVWKLFFPVILVLIGLSLIFKNTFKNQAAKKIKELNRDKTDDEAEEYWATFGEQDVDFDGKEFKGCKIDAVFGGADLDLRGAELKGDVVVKASSIFGGIVIYTPENVNVEIVSTSIFGGVSDNRKNAGRKKKMKDEEKKATKKADNAGKTIYIDATCVFGGVEVR